MNIRLIRASYTNRQHSKDITYLLNAYACDPMGGGKALDKDILDALPRELAKIPHAITILCYVENVPAGLLNAFEAFSTFSCKPIINIHDVVVLKEFRGNNLSQKMLEMIETLALEKGCCKLTLEVLSENDVAKSAYKKFGFSDYQLDPSIGHALFWQKTL